MSTVRARPLQRQACQVVARGRFLAEGADDKPLGIVSRHVQLDLRRHPRVARDQADQDIVPSAQARHQLYGMGHGFGGVIITNVAHVPRHNALVGRHFRANIRRRQANRRQKIRQNAPIGHAAEDMIVQIANGAEMLQHGAAFGFASDAAADQQRAVNIEQYQLHSPTIAPQKM